MKKIVIGLLLYVQHGYGIEPIGLTNLGNTCYINSTLQCLGAIPELRNYIFKFSSHDPLTEEFKRMLKSPIAGPKAFVECVSETGIMGKLAINAQQDAAEFYEKLINKLQPQETIHNLFRINTKMDTISASREFKREPVIQESTILRIGSQFVTKQKGMSIEALIKNYFLIPQEDTIQVERDGVNKEFDIKEKNSGLHLSPILVVAVPRFDMEGNKIKTPLWSNMKPLILTDAKKNKHTYNLLGCVLHAGETVDSGHYTAVARYDNEWFYCDDTQVSLQAESEVGARLSNQDNFDSYLYFFRKDFPLTLQQVADEEKKSHYRGDRIVQKQLPFQRGLADVIE